MKHNLSSILNPCTKHNDDYVGKFILCSPGITWAKTNNNCLGNEDSHELIVPFQSCTLALLVYSLANRSWLWCKESLRRAMLIHLSLPIFVHYYSWLLEYHYYLHKRTTAASSNHNTKNKLGNAYTWRGRNRYLR